MSLIAKIILAIFFAGILVAGCIAVVNDEDAYVSLQWASHEYDDGCWEGECGRYDDGYGEENGGGYTGGHRGGDYGGGRGGADYDGDGDGPRCRNFCFYGVPAPGEEGGGGGPR